MNAKTSIERLKQLFSEAKIVEFKSIELFQCSTTDPSDSLLFHSIAYFKNIDQTGKISDAATHTKGLEDAPSDSGSVAYISETLIKQTAREEKLDLITSLTIHFPKDKLNKKIKVFILS